MASSPIIKEGVFCHTLDLDRVYEERQNFDPVGIILAQMSQLNINRERQTTLKIKDNKNKMATKNTIRLNKFIANSAFARAEKQTCILD